MKKSSNSLRDLWGTMSQNNIHDVKEREREREKGAEIVFKETMAENFLSLVKDINLQIQDEQSQSRINLNTKCCQECGEI